MPWPALAWWTATLPGSPSRGGVTLVVRIVAFGVRAVLCRAATCVAVDVESFVAAAPPRLGEPEAGACGRVGRRRTGPATATSDIGPETVSGAGRKGIREEIREMKEDGMMMTMVPTDTATVGGAPSGAVSDAAEAVVRGGGSDSQKERELDSGFDRRTGSRSGPLRRGAGVVLEASRETIGGRAFLGTDATVLGQGDTCQTKSCDTTKRGGAGVEESGMVVVLLPTHRSYLDFVLVSLLCAAMRSSPGLSWMRVPRVAAAEGPFGKKGSLLRWILEKLGESTHRRDRCQVLFFCCAQIFV